MGYRNFRIASIHRPLGIGTLLLTTAAPLSHATEMALEEVVVTAQKRTELLQDTPISIAAFGSAELENKGIGSLVDLRATVPNLQLRPHPNNGASTQLYMRGVGNSDDQATQDPSVAVYLDGVYVARSQGLAMEVAEIERIEVLRGPQGSLYGRNATGGAINFISASPEFDALRFKQTLTVGNDGLFTSRSKLAVPLAERLVAEAVYLHSEKDGFVANRGTGEDYFGSKDRDAYRFTLRWQPLDSLDAQYSYDRSQLNDTPTYLAQVPLYPRQGHRPSSGSPLVQDLDPVDIDARGHTLLIDWELTDTLSLKSITGYRTLDSNARQDYLVGAVGPYPAIASLSKDDQHQFSQELQLIGDALDHRLEYVAGVYYFEESADSFSYSDIPLLRQRTDYRYDVENSAYAVFGQATWTPALLDDRLHLTFGARWSVDDRKADLQIVSRPYDSPAQTGAPGHGDTDFEDFSPSFVAAYDLAEGVNVYAKVAKGYKTGGFNVRASSIARFDDGFDPEELISYELGLKSQFLDDRVRLNAAVFRADYDDIQINIRSDPNNPRATDVLNAGAATIDGIELDLTARLTEGLTATVNYAYLDADYDEVKNALGIDETSNFRFTFAPAHTYAVNLDYAFPATALGVWTATVGYSYQSEVYSRAIVNSGKYIIDDYGLLNARLSLSEIPVGVGELRLGLWARNIEDREYYIDHNTALVPFAVFGEPRSYGLDVIYEY